jgi:nitrogen fixation protein FixH
MAELTGKHVLAITVGAFSVIITVNFLLAYKAVSTFPGLEVQNSYVASQVFDADKAAQVSLGWTLIPTYEADIVRLAFTDARGQSVTLGALGVLIGRPTETQEDIRPEFSRADGAYVAAATLKRGKWMIKVDARALDGTPFRQRIDLFVKG